MDSSLLGGDDRANSKENPLFPQLSNPLPFSKTNENMKHALTSLATADFTFEVDISDGLTSRSWKNHLTGHALDLGCGPELEVEVDAAKARIWIEGWHLQRTDTGAGRREVVEHLDQRGSTEGKQSGVTGGARMSQRLWNLEPSLNERGANFN